MLTRANTLLSVGWKVAAVALVGTAGAVGYVGYDGARDRVSETFGPGCEAAREWSGRAGEWAADRGDRAGSWVEQNPYLAGSHAAGLLVFALMVRHYRRKGFGAGAAVLAGLTKVAPNPLPGPLTEGDRARNRVALRELEAERTRLLKEGRDLPRQYQDAQADEARRARDVESAEALLNEAVDKLEDSRAARAELGSRLDAAAHRLADVDAEIVALKPLT